MTDYRHDIEKYLKGELTPAERHALEKKALSDPFLADALEGSEKIDSSVFTADVADLNKKIINRKEQSFWTWTMRIAAGVVILLASAYIVWQAFETQPETKQLALEQKNEPVTPPETSTSDSVIKEEATSQPEKTTAGPSAIKKDDSQSAYQSKAAEKPLEKPTDPLIAESKPKPVVSSEGAGEVTPTESIADEDVSLAKSADKEAIAESEAAVKYKSEEVKRSKKLAAAKGDQQKETAAPVSRADRSSGITYADKKIIRGRVTSTEDGSGLPGVNVVIKGTTTGTVTDHTGNYQVEVENANPVLVYSFIGLESREVIAGDRTDVDVSLSLDVAQLSEVVVTGYGNGSGYTATVNLAHPINGYRTFKQYLQQSMRYPSQALKSKVEGKVTVEFTIETNGSLTSFRIIRGIGSGCDEELIRLIQEGPRWEPTKKEGTPIQDKARVRLKFDLPD